MVGVLKRAGLSQRQGKGRPSWSSGRHNDFGRIRCLAVFFVSAMFLAVGPLQVAYGSGGNSNTRQLTDTGANTNNDQPAWSPDGTQIAFASMRGNLSDHNIFVMNADGSDETNLTNDQGNRAWEPSWSPDGSKIAFSYSAGGPEQIYSMDADGTDLVQLTDTGAGTDNDQPAWSPDGTRIAFASQRGNLTYHNVFVMDADGTSQTNLINDRSDQSQEPAWSPDGTQIAFGYAANGEVNQIAVMDVG
jgi:Tol biopolymer transport system component